MEDTTIRQAVRENYGKIARESESCCSPGGRAGGQAKTDNRCCSPGESATAREISRAVGYSEADLDSVPEGANLGLGCGNPIALASLKEGETVLDLGSGAGFDCFLAAQRVGKSGRVIGVDMTPEMLEKARANARRDGFANVEFRMGEIENLPVADNSVDVIISNCVINLSTDKPRVFREAYRVLKPGGRLMVSDIVLTRDIPPAVRESVQAYVSCVGGAEREEAYLGAIEAAGFGEVSVKDTVSFGTEALEFDPSVAQAAAGTGLGKNEIKSLAASVLSIKVSAVKPG